MDNNNKTQLPPCGRKNQSCWKNSSSSLNGTSPILHQDNVKRPSKSSITTTTHTGRRHRSS